MAYSINQAILVGNVSNDPQLKFTPSGKPVCSFSIATSRGVKKGDVWENVATFHRIVVWGKLAEQLGATLTKGRKVTIMGRIDNRSYEDQQGVKKYTSEVVADSVIFEKSDSRPQNNGESDEVPPPAESSNVQDVSDDIPF